MDSLTIQVYAFLVMTLTGMAWGFVLDLYRAWRSLARPRGWTSDLADLGFALAEAILVAAGLFLSNWGELRLYVLLALTAGFGLYHGLASPAVRPAARAGLSVAARALRFTGRVALWPPRTAVRSGRTLLQTGAGAVQHGTAAARRRFAGTARRTPEGEAAPRRPRWPDWFRRFRRP